MEGCRVGIWGSLSLPQDRQGELRSAQLLFWLVARVVVRKGLPRATSCGHIPRVLLGMGPEIQAPIFLDPQKLESNSFIFWRQWKSRACSDAAGIRGWPEIAAEVACGKEAGPRKGLWWTGIGDNSAGFQGKGAGSGQRRQPREPSSWPRQPCLPREEVGEGTGLRPGCSPPRGQLVGMRQVGGGYWASPPPSLPKQSKKLSPFIAFATGCFPKYSKHWQTQAFHPFSSHRKGAVDLKTI